MFGARFLGCAAAVLVLTSVGCSSVPETNNHGRVSVYADGPVDAKHVDMTEFSDRVAQKIASEVTQVRGIRDSASKCVLALGDIENHTSGTSSNTFEMFQHRVRGKVVNSSLRDSMIIIDDPSRVQRLLGHFSNSGQRDLLQEGTGGGGTPQYDPKITYVLTGDFYESDAGGAKQFLFGFKLINLASGGIVFEHQADAAYLK